MKSTSFSIYLEIFLSKREKKLISKFDKTVILGCSFQRIVGKVEWCCFQHSDADYYALAL